MTPYDLCMTTSAVNCELLKDGIAGELMFNTGADGVPGADVARRSLGDAGSMVVAAPHRQHGALRGANIRSHSDSATRQEPDPAT